MHQKCSEVAQTLNELRHVFQLFGDADHQPVVLLTVELSTGIGIVQRIIVPNLGTSCYQTGQYSLPNVTGQPVHEVGHDRFFRFVRVLEINLAVDVVHAVFRHDQFAIPEGEAVIESSESAEISPLGAQDT